MLRSIFGTVSQGTQRGRAAIFQPAVEISTRHKKRSARCKATVGDCQKFKLDRVHGCEVVILREGATEDVVFKKGLLAIQQLQRRNVYK